MPLPDAFHELARRVNNWGRWGDDDELGTLNLVTDEVVRKAAASVVTGERFSLALPLSADGPQTGAIPGRTNPARTMVRVNEPLRDPDAFCSSEDRVEMALQAATHWDSLMHVSYAGRVYNGFGAATIGHDGASRCGIEKVGALVSRGVLLDVARALGVERLDGGYAIQPDDLDRAVIDAVEPGDVVLVRTGYVQLVHAGRYDEYWYPSPGLGAACAAWFHERDVAAVGIDCGTLDVFPPERKDAWLPVHLLHLVEMGMLQGQNFDLEALASACAGDGRYTFLLDASPEPFVGACGGPVNPVAVR